MPIKMNPQEMHRKILDALDALLKFSERQGAQMDVPKEHFAKVYQRFRGTRFNRKRLHFLVQRVE